MALPQDVQQVPVSSRMCRGTVRPELLGLGMVTGTSGINTKTIVRVPKECMAWEGRLKP